VRCIACGRSARVALAAIALTAATCQAAADSCTSSRDTILNGSNLPQKPAMYRTLFRMCLETLQLSNVKDAFVLRAGGIAILPRNDSVSATSTTLAQFCTRFPKGHAHFIGRKERRRVKSVAQAVDFGSVNSTPCVKIMGGG
jgi:hypothetical protein